MPDGTDTVDVKTADGKVWTIPKQNLPLAQKRGATLVQPASWYSRVGKGLKEYTVDPVVSMGKEAYERGQRTQPGSGIGGAAMELPGTIIDAIVNMQGEQVERAAKTQQEFEKKPSVSGGLDTLAETAFDFPVVGPMARDFLSTQDPFEMIGKAAGIILGEKVPKVPKIARGAVETTRNVMEKGAKNTARELFLPPENEVTAAQAAHETEEAKKLSDHTQRAEEIRIQNQRDLQLARSEHEKDLARLDSEYEERVREVGRRTSEDEAAYKTKIEQARDAYARKVSHTEAKRIEASAKTTAAETKRNTLVQPRSGPVYQRLKGMADQVAESATKLDKAVREAYNARWGAWRQAMGDAEGNFENVQNAVVNAENNILKGSPENIAIFRNMLKEGEDPLLSGASVFKGGSRGVDVKDILGSMRSEGERTRFLNSLKDEGVSLEESSAGRAKPGATLPIDEIQGYSTELGNKIYRGHSLPGDVRRALKSVKDAADAEVSRVSDAKGQGSIYKQLKSDWAQYMDDFYDSDGPLYKLKSSLNSDTRVSLLSGGEGARIVDSMGHYARFNPDINTVGRVRSLMKQIRELPSSPGTMPGDVPRPTFPERPSPRETPQRSTGPESVRISPREMPERPQTSPFNREEFQKATFRKTVERFRRFGFDDKGAIMGAIIEAATLRPPYALAYPVLKRAVGKVLGSERFQKWLIENKPQEIIRNTQILTNPRTNQTAKNIARAELEILQGSQP